MRRRLRSGPSGSADPFAGTTGAGDCDGGERQIVGPLEVGAANAERAWSKCYTFGAVA